MLLVEQNARMALAVADEGLVLDSGELVAAGSASDLVDNAEVEELYMGASSLPNRIENPDMKSILNSGLRSATDDGSSALGL